MAQGLDSFLPKSERTPMDVGIPLLWLDGADSTRRILNNNNEVIGVFDKANGRFFGQVDPDHVSAHPSVTTLNGKSAFTMTGANALFGASVPQPVAAVTMFFVYDANNGVLLQADNNALLVGEAAITVGSATGAAPAKLTAVNDDTHILLVYWDAATGELWYKFDEDDKVLLDTDMTRLAAATDGIFVLNADGVGNASEGAVGEVIMYGVKLPAFQMNRIGKYLCTKWNALWSDV